ncbi:hypothetical protein ACC702_38610, partial [Rhizobium ruizarguesonis]
KREGALIVLDAEAVAGGISELRIFFRASPHLQVFLTGRQRHDIAALEALVREKGVTVSAIEAPGQMT